MFLFFGYEHSFIYFLSGEQVVLATVTSYFVELEDNYGVKIVGDVPVG